MTSDKIKQAGVCGHIGKKGVADATSKQGIEDRSKQFDLLDWAGALRHLVHTYEDYGIKKMIFSHTSRSKLYNIWCS